MLAARSAIYMSCTMNQACYMRCIDEDVATCNRLRLWQAELAKMEKEDKEQV